MSHELGHFILGHTQEMLMVEAALKVLVLSLLSIVDVTGGLGSLVYELALPYLGSVLGQSNSRQQEVAADQWGLRINSVSAFFNFF